MKRVLLCVCALTLLAAAAWTQPKVAVLDAVVPKGINSSVVIPVTEKVIERLVNSGRFTVLDRANVEQVLGEREFQVSGLVSDAEVTEAGKYLGADYVVVLKVQKIEDTYFLSAKMIAVMTGVIFAQSSAEEEGKLSVLLSLAERAGDVLAGGNGKTAAAPERMKEPARETPAAPARSAPAPNARIGSRMYIGVGSGTQYLEDYTGYGDYEPYSLSFYTVSGPGNGLCFVGDLVYFDATEESGPEKIDLDVGLGYARLMGPLMPWVAARIGYSYMTWSSYEAYALQYGLDVGMDLRFGNLLLGVLYQLTIGTYTADGYYDLYNSQNSFWVMLGYKF